MRPGLAVLKDFHIWAALKMSAKTVHLSGLINIPMSYYQKQLITCAFLVFSRVTYSAGISLRVPENRWQIV